MKIDRHNPRHWLLLAIQLLFTLLAIIARPLRRRTNPGTIILYGHQLTGNLKAIYDEWSRLPSPKLDLYYLTLNPMHARYLRDKQVQALRCNKLRDMLLVADAEVIITDHGLHLMSPLLSWTNIKFIDVWHGIPFKGFTPEDFALQHQYDEIWVSSPILKFLYINKFGFERNKVVSMGYARTDRLFKAEDRSAYLSESLDLPRSRRIVLYAPTWKQDFEGRELFPFGENQDSFLDALADQLNMHGASLLIRSHQNASIHPKAKENVIYVSQDQFPESEDILLGTDILICDWSSIAFDFLALKRPTIFLDVPPPFSNGFSLGPDYRFGEVITSMDSLLITLRAYLEDPLSYAREHRQKQIDIIERVYGSHTDGKSAQRQLARLSQLVEQSHA